MTINKNCISVVSINEKDHLPVRRQLRKAERCRCSADKGRNNQILRKHNQTLEVWRNTITQKSEETRSHNHTITIRITQSHNHKSHKTHNHTKGETIKVWWNTITQSQSKSEETQPDNHKNNQSLWKHNQTIEPDEDAVKHSQHCQHLSKCHLVDKHLKIVKQTDIGK